MSGMIMISGISAVGGYLLRQWIVSHLLPGYGFYRLIGIGDIPVLRALSWWAV